VEASIKIVRVSRVRTRQWWGRDDKDVSSSIFVNRGGGDARGGRCCVEEALNSLVIAVSSVSKKVGHNPQTILDIRSDP